MRPRAIITSTALAAASVLFPVTAPAASAGTPACGTYTVTSASSTSIIITEGPLCPGDGQANLWLNIPIDDGWIGVGHWTAYPTATTSGQLVYVCQGNAYNTFLLTAPSWGPPGNISFTDYCGPQEP